LSIYFSSFYLLLRIDFLFYASAKAMPKGGTYLITYLNYGLILANPLIRDVFSGDNREKNG